MKVPFLINFLNPTEQPVQMSDWSFCVCNDVAQQPNGYDCGLFTCFFAHQIIRGYDLSKCDIPETRFNIEHMLNIEYVPFDSLKTERKKKLPQEINFSNCNIKISPKNVSYKTFF